MEPSAATADLVLTGAEIFTAATSARWARALAISGDRIIAVGTDEDVRPLIGPRTREVRLGRRTVVPGLNDAHAHVQLHGPDTELGLRHDPTLDEVCEELDAIDDGEGWVVGVIGSRVLHDDRIQRDVLDAVAPDRPVWLAGYTGHGAVTNSAGLRWLQLGDRPAVAGGWYERCGDGRHRGVLHAYEGWVAARRRRASQPRATAVDSYRGVGEAAVRWGITSYQQMAGDRDSSEAVSVLREAGASVRWRVVPMPMSPDEQLTMEDQPAGELPPGVVVSGRKWILDGTPVEGAAAVRRPWDDLGHSGRLNFSAQQLLAIAQDALDRDEQLLLHICGDAAAVAALEALARTGGPGTWSGRRVRVEHGDLLDHELADRFAALGATVVQNPIHFLDARILPRRLGQERRSNVLLLRDLPRRGLGFALGSDGPLNPWFGVRAATAAPARPDQALSREEAVTAYTHGSAFAEFTEQDKGTLEPGKLADLAVLDRDVFDVETDELPATTSVLTIVGGKVVHAEAPFDVERSSPGATSETR